MTTHSDSDGATVTLGARALSDVEVTHLCALLKIRHIRGDRFQLELNPGECTICQSVAEKLGLLAKAERLRATQ